MQRKLPPYVIEYRSRGRTYRYFRRKGEPNVRMRGEPWSPDFMAMYARLLNGRGGSSSEAKRPPTGTLAWLVDQYELSSSFRGLDPSTQRVRSRVLASCLAEPIAPGSATTFGEVGANKITPKAIRVLRDRKAEKPAAANHRIKAFRQLFAFAVEEEHVDVNPARDVPVLRINSEGHHSWSLEEVEQFEAHHPIGTQARLALAILLYTAQRVSDVVTFGPPKVRAGWLFFTQHKNRNRRPVIMEIPIRPELQQTIDASETGEDTWLVTAYGQAFTANGFGNKFRKWCDQAGLPHCTAHGLRKAAATRLAENGATEQQIMAITGHRTSAQVTGYTRAARQKRLAEQAFALDTAAE